MDLGVPRNGGCQKQRMGTSVLSGATSAAPIRSNKPSEHSNSDAGIQANDVDDDSYQFPPEQEPF